MEQGVLFAAVILNDGLVDPLTQGVIVVASLKLAVFVVFAEPVLGVVAVVALLLAAFVQDVAGAVEYQCPGNPP
ncbi:hypothetical protein SAMN05216217_1274 [Halopseudomonas yangmingensis]|uniref:Uncharacterized protein n=1 Tax=Halopseudomonas yangmingensis TaxID=1720063 RepID=A0A1I4UMQ7_9GAMM|nr:hypothetical protein SAMN05216217_1274 [Halopseudomonas yangmingensis]